MVLSRAASREVDRLAWEEFGLATIVLMENAALGLARASLETLAEIGGRRCVICCGTGNNGGDGLALARHLHNGGVETSVLLAGAAERLSPDARMHWRTTRAMGIPARAVDGHEAAKVLEELVEPPVLVVDALVGTGLTSAPRGAVAAMIGAINRARRAGVVVLAVDVPSGLDADEGTPVEGGVCVHADRTVTFAAYKPGLLREKARAYTGEARVCPIGVPRELLTRLGRALGGDESGGIAGGSGD